MAKAAIARTLEAIGEGGKWEGNNANTAKAKWFLNRAKKSDKKKKLEKASRKRNRR